MIYSFTVSEKLVLSNCKIEKNYTLKPNYLYLIFVKFSFVIYPQSSGGFIFFVTKRKTNFTRREDRYFLREKLLLSTYL